MGSWIIGGAIIGFFVGLYYGSGIGGIIGGIWLAVVIRKWIFRNLWM